MILPFPNLRERAQAWEEWVRACDECSRIGNGWKLGEDRRHQLLAAREKKRLARERYLGLVRG